MGNVFCKKTATHAAADEDMEVAQVEKEEPSQLEDKPIAGEEFAPELGETGATGEGAPTEAVATELKSEKKEASASGATSVSMGPYEDMVISHIIGPHGKTLNKIKEDTDCEVEVNEDGSVSVSGDNTPKAVEMIEKIVEEAKNPDYEGAEGKRLRAEAQALYSERDELSPQVQLLFDSGDKGKAHAMLKKVKELLTQAKAKDKEAARAIWENRNHESELKMDFHGLRVDEALELFEEHLSALQAKDKSERVLEVIPGAGNHSKGGKDNAKLKPATIKKLKELKLEFVEHNEGSMYVNLDGASEGNFQEKCKELSNPESAI